MEVHGIAEWVVVRGRVAVEDGEVRAQAGLGQFVPTPPNCHHVYGRVHERDTALAPKKVSQGYSVLPSCN